jgi:ubiquitin carboxyl-terminal hydrolase 4/11/15
MPPIRTTLEGNTRVSPLLCEEMLTARSSRSRVQFNRRRPVWTDVKTFLRPQFQNLFEMGICTETSSPIPTGSHSVSDDRDYPRLSSRVPAESFSSEDQLDNATNGTASNDESSSDEASRRSAEMPPTRMNEESDDEGNGPAVKVLPSSPHSWHRRNVRVVKRTHNEQSLMSY